MKDKNEVPEVVTAGRPEIDPSAEYPSPREVEENAPDLADSHGTTLVCRVESKPIVEQVANFIERFVFLKTKSLYQFLALWTIATHMYLDFEYMGYIFACSPEPESGKSRLLEVLHLLVASSSGLLVSPSEAVLFRTSKGQTQLLDEVDGWTNKEQLRNVLNAGYHSEGKVPRMMEEESGYEVEFFPVYAPRALAGIGNRILDETTRNRTFAFDMVRAKPSERREQLRQRKIRPTSETLKNGIQRWIDEHKHEVIALYDRSDFPYLERFRDRTIDVTQPLASILETIYKNHPEQGRARADFLEAICITRKEEGGVADDHRILRTLTELARGEDPLVGNPSELADRCESVLGERPEDHAVSGILLRYGFESKSIRKGETVRYRYSLPYAALADLLDRYGGAAREGQVCV